MLKQSFLGVVGNKLILLFVVSYFYFLGERWGGNMA